VSREDVDPALVAKEREVLLEQARTSGKPEAILQKMVDGRLDKFYEEIVLLEQPFIKDPDRKVKDLLDQMIAKIGENIVVRRFTKFRIGEN
jgi:elongation factor Ts